jgi:ribosomal protein S12 methylthiotransferase
VGFPGETEQEFEQLLEWLDAAQLDRVGCFKYSAVEGAAANAVGAAVPEEVKQSRYERFMERAGTISAARLSQRVGTRCRVLVDSIERGVAIARSAAEAPEIDGVIRILRGAKLAVGEFADVKIVAADTYDLTAEALTLPAAH